MLPVALLAWRSVGWRVLVVQACVCMCGLEGASDEVSCWILEDCRHSFVLWFCRLLQRLVLASGIHEDAPCTLCMRNVESAIRQVTHVPPV